MENKRGLDRSVAMADMRFSFIERICEKTVGKPKREQGAHQEPENLLGSDLETQHALISCLLNGLRSFTGPLM